MKYLNDQNISTFASLLQQEYSDLTNQNEVDEEELIKLLNIIHIININLFKLKLILNPSEKDLIKKRSQLSKKSS
jgi:hypothetical protein